MKLSSQCRSPCQLILSTLCTNCRRVVGIFYYRFFIIQLAYKYYQRCYVFEIKIAFSSSQVIKSSFYITEHFVTAASQTTKTKNCKKLKIKVDLWKIYFFHGNFYLERLIIWDVSSHLIGMRHLQIYLFIYNLFDVDLFDVDFF